MIEGTQTKTIRTGWKDKGQWGGRRRWKRKVGKKKGGVKEER